MDRILTSAVRLVNFIKDHKLPISAAAAAMVVTITAVAVATNGNQTSGPTIGDVSLGQVKSAQTTNGSNPSDNTKAAGESSSNPDQATTPIATSTPPAASKAATPTNTNTGIATGRGSSTSSSSSKPTATPPAPTPTTNPQSPTPAPAPAPSFSIKSSGGGDPSSGYPFTVVREPGYSGSISVSTRIVSQPAAATASCAMDPDKTYLAYLIIPTGSPAGKYTCEFVASDGTVTKTSAYSATIR